MSRGVLAAIAVAAVVVGIVGILSSGYNRLVDLEERLEAQHAQTRNVFGSITNEIQAQGLTVGEYRASVLEAIDAAITGRYGQGGADAAILFMREQNPQMAPAVFLKLQSVISAGYGRFERAQAVKLDIIREYESALRRFPSNMVAGAFGFPQADLDALKRIVVAADTDAAFDSGTAAPIDPFAGTKPQ